MKCPQHPRVPANSGQGPQEMGATLLRSVLADLLAAAGRLWTGTRASNLTGPQWW